MTTSDFERTEDPRDTIKRVASLTALSMLSVATGILVVVALLH